MKYDLKKSLYVVQKDLKANTFSLFLHMEWILDVNEN